MMGSSYSDSGG